MQISIFGFKVEIRKQTKLEEFRGYMAKAFGEDSEEVKLLDRLDKNAPVLRDDPKDVLGELAKKAPVLRDDPKDVLGELAEKAPFLRDDPKDVLGELAKKAPVLRDR